MATTNKAQQEKYSLLNTLDELSNADVYARENRYVEEYMTGGGGPSTYVEIHFQRGRITGGAVTYYDTDGGQIAKLNEEQAKQVRQALTEGN